MKRHIISLTLGAALALAPLSAMAADTQPQQAPQADLTPGPAAGVQAAQGFELGTPGYVAIGIAAIAIVAVAASGNGGGSSSTTTTGIP